MPIFDFFKKRKKVKEKKKEEKKVKIKKLKKEEEIEKPKPAKKEKPTEPKKPTKKVSRPKRKISKLAYRILKEPHVTEKATFLAERNQYVFKVFPRSNKTEIKKAIKDLYGVDVLNVNIIKVPRKRRRSGRISGWKKGYKKAIIKIKEGQKIEVLPR